MERFGLIQLSDLQFGKKHRFENPSNIAEALARDIDYLSEKYTFIPIYLLLTGDITESAHADEFNDAQSVIKNLGAAVSIDKESVICVPGNHDINWILSEAATSVGDPNLKYNLFNKFISASSNLVALVGGETYPTYIDDRFGIEFLLINSCEKETHDTHYGFVDKQRLINSIPKNNKYLRMALIHHRVELCSAANNDVIINANEIQDILRENNYKIIFSGHVHQTHCFEQTQNGLSIIHTGAGAAGVDMTGRVDGVQNQYSIHILDASNKRLETYWRAYSPVKLTRFGYGGWTEDTSVSANPSISLLPEIKTFDNISACSIKDPMLMDKFNIRSNPFTFNNAEKISASQIIDLFVSSEGRNKSAVRLTGDAILRGSRGSGKTMLLRYLEIFGNVLFNDNLRNKKVSESFPVMVNFSFLHPSERAGSIPEAMLAAEKLIFDSILDALNKKSDELQSPEFRDALFRTKQKLNASSSLKGSLIWKLGIAIRENLSKYFQHVLLLIDEVAPVFPKEFFTERNGFMEWMNVIRNNVPYFTRVAVYPSDISDVLNEERFGSVVNLDYDIRNSNDYLSFRNYCIELVNKYLRLVSISPKEPTTITNIIKVTEDAADPLEQLIYASDGSSRRFLSLMDKCLTSPVYKNQCVYTKDEILLIIKEFSTNLLSSYSLTDKEIALSIAKACKKQITYRFRLPGLSGLIMALYAKKEELNIIKLAEIGTGRRGTTYEFSYPYCILMDLPTHYLKDSRKLCTSRDYLTGEWITPVTTIQKDQLDFLSSEFKLSGEVTALTVDLVEIKSDKGIIYIAEGTEDALSIGDRVSFIGLKDNIATDVTKI